MKNFNILQVHRKIRVLEGRGSQKNNIKWEGLPKKGGLDSLQIYRGAWQERGDGVFEGGLIPQCTLCVP